MHEDLFEKLEAHESTMEYAVVDFLFDVSNALGLVLERKGLKPVELAKALGKSKSFVSQVLSGKQNLTLKTVAEICFVLKVNPRELVGQSTLSGVSAPLEAKGCVKVVHVAEPQPTVYAEGSLAWQPDGNGKQLARTNVIALKPKSASANTPELVYATR